LEKLEDGNWVLARYSWGKIEVVSNAMTAEHGALENRNLYAVTLRNFNQIDKTMRIVYREKVLYIRHIDNTDPYCLKILCEELE
jgi:head-tail adaptor